ncbi:MAG TPA: PPC domain-containing protein [Bryobacteraceae bacterium]|nr:PPC domain-containing protein [Bryobacteraceae bacterium]
MRFLLAALVLLPALCAQTCAPAARLQPVDSVSGTIDVTSCELSDGSSYAEYSLTLSTRGQIQLEGASNDFPLTLILRDESGHKIDSGTSIRRPLERGRYSVRVDAGASGQTGAFTLKSNFTLEPGTLCRDFPSIGLNQALTGNLSSGGCLLPDGSPFDGYTVTTYGPGTLQIALQADGFDAYLILRSADGHLLASGDAGGAGNTAQISYALLGNQMYTIAASSGDGGTGGYHLTLSFASASGDPCQPVKSLNPGDQDQGTVTSKGCLYTDPASGQQVPFNWYSIQVAAAGLADLRLSSQAFDPVLWLIDPSGNVIAADAETGGKGLSVIRQQLVAGTYTVLAFSTQTTGGAYSLQYSLFPGPPASCPVLQIQPGTAVTGKLDVTSTCRTATGIADVYRFTTSSAGTLSIAMTSGDFYPYLELWDEKDNRVVADAGAYYGAGSSIQADLPAGTYAIVAGTIGGQGGYNLGYQLTGHALAACGAPATLQPPGYIGLLGGAASCPGPNGQPVDWYQFTTDADATIAAVMTSQNLDSFLALQDSQGNLLRWDDNSYGQQDAMLVQFLPAGTYRISARAAENSGGGLYELDLRVASGPRPAGCGPLRSVAPGDSVTAQLSYTSCQYPDDTFADLYQLTLAASTTLQIDMTSTDFDAYLQILDAKGNILFEDDNGGGTSNARISRTLDAGTYFVVAKPYADYASQGNYALTVTQK